MGQEDGKKWAAAAHSQPTIPKSDRLLAQQGKAAKLSGGGYPNRYTARAGDVLPLIEGDGIKPSKDGVWIFGTDEGEEYAQPPGSKGKVAVHPDRVAACPADQVLTIDAWDQS